MTEPGEDPMLAATRLRATRRSNWLSDADKSPLRRLGQIGVLGWIIVTPMLIGIFTGRWMDLHYNTGLFWTAPMLMLGAALGCWSAWKWMGSA
jgi:ATP synthase protein I